MIVVTSFLEGIWTGEYSCSSRLSQAWKLGFPMRKSKFQTAATGQILSQPYRKTCKYYNLKAFRGKSFHPPEAWLPISVTSTSPSSSSSSSLASNRVSSPARPRGAPWAPCQCSSPSAWPTRPVRSRGAATLDLASLAAIEAEQFSPSLAPVTSQSSI